MHSRAAQPLASVTVVIALLAAFILAAAPLNTVKALASGRSANLAVVPVQDVELLNGDGFGGSLTTLTGGYDLKVLGGLPVWVFASNPSGVQAGMLLQETALHAFYDDGTLHDLGTLGGQASLAHGINTSGEVVGWLTQPDLNTTAFLFDGTPHLLPTLGDTSSWAFGIGDNGVVVGQSSAADGSLHAFAYDGSMHDLGIPLGGQSSIAWGVDTANEVIGTTTFADGHSRPFLYDTDGSVYDLNSLLIPGSGWTLDSATAINDGGDVVASGHDAQDNPGVVLLSDLLPAITQQPVDQVVLDGDSATFSAVADRGSSVQWQVTANGGATWQDLTGETGTSLSFVVSPGQSGHGYRAVFRNAYGQNVTSPSQGALLTVTQLPPPPPPPPPATPELDSLLLLGSGLLGLGGFSLRPRRRAGKS